MGSGKTTLLCEILRENLDKKCKVIINEFGEVGVDSAIVDILSEIKSDLIASGCVCCNKQSELVSALKNALDFEIIIIETTGLANPASIAFSVLTDSLLTNHFFIASTICVVDALNLNNALKNEVQIAQIAASDKIIISKDDIFWGDLEDIFKKIRAYNAVANIEPKSKMDFKRALESSAKNAIDFNKIPQFRQNEVDIGAFGNLVIEFNKISWDDFSVWLSLLLHSYGEKILRIKGIVSVGEKYPVAINGVGHIIHPPTHLKNSPNKKSQIIIIFKDLDKNRILDSFFAITKVDCVK